jgi:hypothetical protein
MAIKGAIPVAFDDVYPHGAFGSGEVEKVKDWDRSSAKEFVQAEVEAMDPGSGEVVRLPAWSVVILDGDPTEKADPVVVQVLSRHQPVLPEPVAGLPFRPVVLEGMVIEAVVNRDKCKAPWDGRQHRCGARVAYKVWARGIRSPQARGERAAAAGNAKAATG